MGSRGKLLQGTTSNVTLEITQASGPRDSLQIRSGGEQGTFCLGWGLGRGCYPCCCQARVDCNRQPAGPPDLHSKALYMHIK